MGGIFIFIEKRRQKKGMKERPASYLCHEEEERVAAAAAAAAGAGAGAGAGGFQLLWKKFLH